MILYKCDKDNRAKQNFKFLKVRFLHHQPPCSFTCEISMHSCKSINVMKDWSYISIISSTHRQRLWRLKIMNQTNDKLASLLPQHRSKPSTNSSSYLTWTWLLVWCLAKLPRKSASSRLPSSSIHATSSPH